MEEQDPLGIPRLRDEDVLSYVITCVDGLNSIQSYFEDVNEFVQNVVGDRIWQRDGFNFKLVNLAAQRVSEEEESSPVWAWAGRTRFAENIEDAWFIIYLLFELSKQFKHLCARVWDEDGDPLLIECAHEIPEWLTPQSSPNRVWIRQGSVVLIDSAGRSTRGPGVEERGPLTVAEAVGILTQGGARMLPRAAQDLVRARIALFPQGDFSAPHRAAATLPLAAAHVLQRLPQTAAAAARALYLRDPPLLRACAAMRHLGASPLVSVRVRLTRCLYAQMTQQQFQAPPVFKTPPGDAPATARERHALSLGVRLACGLEMAYTEALGRSRAGAAETTDENGGQQAWETFVHVLAARGYFRGMLPKSKEYERLMAAARAKFASSEGKTSQPRSGIGEEEAAGGAPPRSLETCPLSHARAMARGVGMALSERFSAAEFPDRVAALAADDSSAWMQVEEADVDDLILQRMGPAAGGVGGSNIVTGVETFMKKESGLEGAEPGDGGGFDPEAFLSILAGAVGAAPPAPARLSPAEGAGADPLNDSDYEDGDGAGDLGPEDPETVAAMQAVGRELLGDAEDMENDSGAILDNLLQSYHAQDGGAGPASALLEQILAGREQRPE